MARPWWIGWIPWPPDDQVVSVVHAETVVPVLMQEPVTTVLGEGQHTHPTTSGPEFQGGAGSLDAVRSLRERSLRKCFLLTHHCSS